MFCERCTQQNDALSVKCFNCGNTLIQTGVQSNTDAESQSEASKKKKSSLFGDMNISSKEECEKAIKNGWIAGLVSFSLTLGFGIAGFFTTSDNSAMAYFLDPWLLVDAFLILILTFCIYKKSRVGATLMFLYFTLSKLDAWYTLGKADGLIISIFFFLFYLNAMRGTYVWHSQYKPNQTFKRDS
jgi:hypothetical protein